MRFCTKSEFAENVEERLDEITPGKCIISNSNEASEILGQWCKWLIYEFIKKV